MKKLLAAAVALLLCLMLTAPVFAAENTQPTDAPAAEPTPEPIAEPAPDVTETPTAESTPEPTDEPIAEPTLELPTSDLTEGVMPLADDAPIYSVDITWGDMEFSYRAAGTWNPKTLSYADGGWTPAESTVKVDNYSTAPVVATISAEIDSSIPGIGDTGVSFPSGDVMELAANETKAFTVAITGAPTGTFGRREIGTLTVTVTAPAGE